MKLIIGNKAYSSWSLRGWLACRQSGLPFEEVVVPLYDQDWDKRREGADFAPGTLMYCGTLGAIGGIRPSSSFAMELYDPRSGRSLRHQYAIEVLPEVA